MTPDIGADTGSASSTRYVGSAGSARILAALIGAGALLTLGCAVAGSDVLVPALTTIRVDRSLRVPTAEEIAGARLALAVISFTLGIGAAIIAFSRPASRVIDDTVDATRKALRSRLAVADAWIRRSHREDLITLLIVFAVGLWMRADLAGHPVSYDEAITYVRFVSRSLTDVLSDYSIPNNHVLHNAAAWVTTRALGPGLLSLRLPALVAGTLLIPATYWLAWRLYDRRTALLAAGLVSVAPALVEYSAQARGYTIVGLLFVSGFILASYLRDRTDDSGGWVLFAVLFALAGFTIPTALYALAVVVSWMWLSTPPWHRGILLRRLVPALGLTGLLTGLLYLPIVLRSGLRSLIANRYVDSLDWRTLLRQSLEVARGVAECWSGRLDVVAILLASGMVMAVLQARGGDRRALQVVCAIVLGIVPLVLLQRVAPFARALHFLFPVVAATAAFGIRLGVARVSREMPAAHSIWVAIAAGVPLAWGLTRMFAPDASYARELARLTNVPPGAEGMNCCAEGYFVDAELVAADATALLGPGDIMAAHRYSGTINTTGFYLLLRGRNPSAMFPFDDRRGLTQLEEFERVFFVAKSSGDTTQAPLAHVLAASRLSLEEYRRLFRPPRVVRMYRSAVLYLLERNRVDPRHQAPAF